MSLFPSNDDRRFVRPIFNYIDRVFDNFLSDFDRSAGRSGGGYGIAPSYWYNQPLNQQYNIGNTVGKVIDDAEKFVVEVDVSQFHPKELSVNFRENELVIEGHHEERSDDAGSIERHFVRKYTVPQNTQSDTLQSQLTQDGVLKVSAKKLAVGAPPQRSIPIEMSRE